MGSLVQQKLWVMKCMRVERQNHAQRKQLERKIVWQPRQISQHKNSGSWTPQASSLELSRAIQTQNTSKLRSDTTGRWSYLWARECPLQGHGVGEDKRKTYVPTGIGVGGGRRFHRSGRQGLAWSRSRWKSGTWERRKESRVKSKTPYQLEGERDRERWNGICRVSCVKNMSMYREREREL